MLLSTAYFPPIEYFAILAKCSIALEACERYEKQSYRNRCRILTSNGVEDLRVPIVHDGARLIRDIKVDYSTPWVRQTKYAIETAYCSSPFFEYYRDPLFAILDSHPETLWELNLRIIMFFCEKIGMAPEISFTQEYQGPALDIHPKHPSTYKGTEYWQVFKSRFGFVQNLSIMDLLFNEGPESLSYLLD